jgi:hypothetical protein
VNRHLDEQELRALFAEIELPPGLDRWRERIADVHAEPYEPAPDDAEPEPEPAVEEVKVETNGVVVALPTGELRPKRQRKRSVAVAAAAAAVVGLGGVVVTTQLFGEAPPADPMIIDGPDKTVSSAPSTVSRDVVPSGAVTPPPPTSQGQGQPDQGGNQDGEQGADGGPDEPDRTGREEPSWPPMAGDPTSANTGVPLGASLSDHYGNLRITTPGQVVSDLRVTGSVIVDAPNVTLRRVLVIASYGAPAVRQNADNLTIDSSELSGGQSLTQGGTGLVIRRSRLENGVTITTGAQLYDNHLDVADVLIPSHSNSVLLRHNTMGRVTMNDLDAPITGVTIENSLLTQVDAPTEAGSAGIHVLGNRFRGSAPSTGWNSAGNDYQWSNNTFADSGAPANP